VEPSSIETGASTHQPAGDWTHRRRVPMGVVRTAAVGLGHVGPGRESGNQRQAPVPSLAV